MLPGDVQTICVDVKPTLVHAGEFPKLQFKVQDHLAKQKLETRVEHILSRQVSHEIQIFLKMVYKEL